MNIDILLVYPPLHRLYGERKEWMPLGILSLASYLNQNGIYAVAYNADCSSIEGSEHVMSYKERFQKAKNYQTNLNSNNFVWDEYIRILGETNPKVVGITVLTEALGSVKKIVALTKAFNSRIKVVLGGPHAEIDPVLLLDEVSGDYAIRGEGEIPLLKIMTNLLSGDLTASIDKIEGLCYYKNGAFYANHNNVRLNTDKLPIPKLEHHFEYQKYRKVGKKLNVTTSRGGCMHSCAFCYCSKFRDKIRWRSPGRIYEELQYYVSIYKTKKIFFVDDTFTSNKKFVIDLCTLLINNPLPIEWTCTTRANQLDNEIIPYMKKAGCRSIHIGIESGSERMLSFMNKRVKVDEILVASDIIKENGIECKTFFMVGMPTESKIDIDMSIKLLENINPDEAVLNIYVPIPQTKFYDYIKHHFYNIDEIDWLSFSRDTVPYEKYMDASFGDINDAIDRMFEAVERINSRNKV